VLYAERANGIKSNQSFISKRSQGKLSWLVRMLCKRNSFFLEGGRGWGNSGCSSNRWRSCPGDALAMSWHCPSDASAAAAVLAVAFGDERATSDPPSDRQPQDLSWQEQTPEEVPGHGRCVPLRHLAWPRFGAERPDRAVRASAGAVPQHPGDLMGNTSTSGQGRKGGFCSRPSTGKHLSSLTTPASSQRC